MADPFDRPARPWDLFNKNLGRVEGEVALDRLEICKSCEHFIKATTQCTKCGCVMNAKVKLPNAECPIHKWEQVKVSYRD